MAAKETYGILVCKDPETSLMTPRFVMTSDGTAIRTFENYHLARLHLLELKAMYPRVWYSACVLRLGETKHVA